MTEAKVVHPENVMPFVTSDTENLYLSRMLIDKYNCGSEKFQVNHGTLKAGKRLSGEAHEGHDELYIILKGEADLDLDSRIYKLKPGSVVYIPGGTFHALINTEGSEDLELITVWPGIPKFGINQLYDLRKEQWGTTYKEIKNDS